MAYPRGLVSADAGRRTIRSRYGKQDCENRAAVDVGRVVGYALINGALQLELATIEAKGWGKRPVKLTTYDEAAVEPGLLLLAAFVVGALTEYSQRNVAAVTRAGYISSP